MPYAMRKGNLKSPTTIQNSFSFIYFPLIHFQCLIFPSNLPSLFHDSMRDAFLLENSCPTRFIPIIIMHLYFTNIYVWYTIHMFILQYVNSTANHSWTVCICVYISDSDKTLEADPRNRERPWVESVSQCDSHVLNFQQEFDIRN